MIRPGNNDFGLLAGERNYRFGALAEPLKRIDDLTCCYGRPPGGQPPDRTEGIAAARPHLATSGRRPHRQRLERPAAPTRLPRDTLSRRLRGNRRSAEIQSAAAP